MTNDNAPNYKIMVAEKEKPESRFWKTLIPEKQDGNRELCCNQKRISLYRTNLTW